MSKSNGTVREVAAYLAEKQAQGWKGSKSIHGREWPKLVKPQSLDKPKGS